MPVNVNQQTIVFLMCVLTGMASGMVCDILNITAKKLRFGKSAFFIQDILIWCIILAFFFSVIYKINGAALRWYVFFGALLGAMLYILMFRAVTVKAVMIIVELIFKIIRKIVRVLLIPVSKMRWIFKPVLKFVQNARKRVRNFVQKNIAKIRRIKILLNKV